jgi:hypothetical protein
VSRSAEAVERTGVGSSSKAPGHTPFSRKQARADHGVARVGLRRVDWVRLVLDQDQRCVGAEVVGVGFRLPVTCAISVEAAEDLIAQGTPYVIRFVDARR